MNSLQHAPNVYGSNRKPLHLCASCGAYIVAATWSEHVSERCIRNVWSCDTCGCEFETSAYFPAKLTSN